MLDSGAEFELPLVTSGRDNMLYEVINPSDPYTIEANSLDVAAVTVLLLGQGHYGLRCLGDEPDVPMFAFADGDAWCKQFFGEGMMELSNRVMDTKLPEVAESLDSILYGDKEDREKFVERTKVLDQDVFLVERAAWQDRCSSMNDIGNRAYIMAAKLKKSIAEGLSTVQ